MEPIIKPNINIGTGLKPNMAGEFLNTPFPKKSRKTRPRLNNQTKCHGNSGGKFCDHKPKLILIPAQRTKSKLPKILKCRDKLSRLPHELQHRIRVTKPPSQKYWWHRERGTAAVELKKINPICSIGWPATLCNLRKTKGIHCREKIAWARPLTRDTLLRMPTSRPANGMQGGITMPTARWWMAITIQKKLAIMPSKLNMKRQMTGGRQSSMTINRS